ncbi:hypothetical protein [uncultured Brachyspira sp.]|uniref:type II restriction enzyme n=1 Tax=uncultured Brachyspira sp. TaxID=221953 RepID=UPI0026048F2B|nr:hypothetical protein [uncultured Brachyspira sp.]
MNNNSWKAIFDKYNIYEHNFDNEPFYITNKMIKDATKHFNSTSEKEVRILCKQDHRKSRPDIFIKKGLFLLPVKNGKYVIIKGEGYIDIPDITSKTFKYESKLEFDLDTSKIGNSEMQHLDFAYASSIIRTFTEDNTLVLTIRGKKYTPKFSFYVEKTLIEVESVQTEVDAGYEGRNNVVLIEAKNSTTKDTIIRQLYYPYRQWSEYTSKNVRTLFFEKRYNEYLIWEFKFKDINSYNSIYLYKKAKYSID